MSGDCLTIEKLLAAQKILNDKDVPDDDRYLFYVDAEGVQRIRHFFKGEVTDEPFET